jgi:ribonucleotide reductase beta subunit family protein with ferritin-like domain
MTGVYLDRDAPITPKEASIHKLDPDVEASEPLLTEEKSRHVYFPVKYYDLHDMYKKAASAYWVAEEIDFGQDLKDLNRLSKNEKHFIKQVLAFFAASDGIVMENLGTRFMNDVAIAEAKAFYAFQIAMEQVHSETYSLLIDTYERDPEEKEKLFNAVDTFPAIHEKAQWAMKWIQHPDASFAQRLIAFAIVEGVYFSSSFAAIFWLRERGILPGLSYANQLISRDENLHTEFACLLYSKIHNRVPERIVREMFEEAVEIEDRFITESIPCSMINMNEALMKDYIKYIADRTLLMLGYDKMYNKANPFAFMEASTLDSKGNFFECKISEYTKAGINSEGKSLPVKVKIDLNADF